MIKIKEKAYSLIELRVESSNLEQLKERKSDYKSRGYTCKSIQSDIVNQSSNYWFQAYLLTLEPSSSTAYQETNELIKLMDAFKLTMELNEQAHLNKEKLKQINELSSYIAEMSSDMISGRE